MAGKNDKNTAEPPSRRTTRSMAKGQVEAPKPEAKPKKKTVKVTRGPTAKDEAQDLSGTTKGKKSKITPAKKAVVSNKAVDRSTKTSNSELKGEVSQKPSRTPKSKQRKHDTSDDEPVAAESEPAKGVTNRRSRKTQFQNVAESIGVSSQEVKKSNGKKRNRETADGAPPSKRSKTSESAQSTEEDIGSNAKNSLRAPFPPIPPVKHKSWMDKFNHNHKHYQKELKKLGGRPKWPLSKSSNDVIDQAVFKAIGAVWRTSWTSGKQYSLAIPKGMAGTLKGSQLKLDAIPGKCYELILPLRLNNGKGDPVIVKVEARAPVRKEEAMAVILTLFDGENEKKAKEHEEILAKAEQIVQRCGWWAFKNHKEEPATSTYAFTHVIAEVPKDPNTHPAMATTFHAWAIMLNLSPMTTTTTGDALDRGKQAGVVGRQVLNCVLGGAYDLATIEAFLIAHKYVNESSMRESMANHAYPIIYSEVGCASGFVEGIVSDDWKVDLHQKELSVNGNASRAVSKVSETANSDRKPADNNQKHSDKDADLKPAGSTRTSSTGASSNAVSFRRRRRGSKLRTALSDDFRTEEWQEIYEAWCNKNATPLSRWASRRSRTIIPAQTQLYEEHVFGGIGALWAGLWEKGQMFGFGRSDTFQLLRAGQSPSEIDRLTTGITMGLPETSITLILPLVGYGTEFSIEGLEEVPSPVRKSPRHRYEQRIDGHWILAVAERPNIKDNVVVLKIYDSVAGKPSEAMWQAAEIIVRGSGLFGIEISGVPRLDDGYFQFDRRPMACPQQPSGVACGVSTIINAWCCMLGIDIPAERRYYDDDNEAFLKDVEHVIARAMDGVMDAFGIRAFLYSWGYTVRERLSRHEDETAVPCRAVGKDCQALNTFVTGVLRAENHYKRYGTIR